MPDGGELSLVTCDDGDGVVEVSVRDTGDGIEPATLERVFEPFYTTRSECGNSGLGLAIVRRIVQSHGGRIQLDSRPGQGTMARVLLPRGSVHLGAALHVDATVRGSKV
jgi:signal transduction histidine kinase